MFGRFKTENPQPLWIKVPNFDIDSTITWVILAKAQQGDQNNQDDNIHLDLANVSLQSTATSPLSSASSSRQSSPICALDLKPGMSILVPPSIDMQVELAHMTSNTAGIQVVPDIAPLATSPQLRSARAQKTRRSKKKKNSNLKASALDSVKSSVQKKHTLAAHDCQRQKRKLESRALKQSRSNTTAHVLNEAKPIVVQWDCLTPVARSSGYIGQDWVEGPGKVWMLEEMVGPNSRFKFKLVQWDGKPVLFRYLAYSCQYDIIFRTSIPIIDKDGRIFLVLVGSPPGDTTWDGVHEQAGLLLDHYRLTVTRSHMDHPPRRNVWCSISTGYSFGGGQKVSDLVDA
ncbi:hypothetical protein VKT23_020711 [Stygiomarasmius scandens]|uniref:Uncharacterized protein n=1 Tax=Marasmiellus scandens TaxID=2682957 RepID=A0ABR1IKX3_9AGAR